MASVLLSFENQGEDKHVESVLLPRSDTGSTPVSSTFIILSWEALKCEAMAFTHEKRVQVPSQLHNLFFIISKELVRIQPRRQSAMRDSPRSSIWLLRAYFIKNYK